MTRKVIVTQTIKNENPLTNPKYLEWLEQQERVAAFKVKREIKNKEKVDAESNLTKKQLRTIKNAWVLMQDLEFHITSLCPLTIEHLNKISQSECDLRADFSTTCINEEKEYEYE